jgi:hypothetical protein
MPFHRGKPLSQMTPLEIIVTAIGFALIGGALCVAGVASAQRDDDWNWIGVDFVSFITISALVGCMRELCRRRIVH